MSARPMGLRPRFATPTQRQRWSAARAHRHRRRPIRSGRFHRVLWPSGFPIVVVPELADQLSVVLEEFAQASGSTTASPLKVVLRPGTMGLHRAGRAVDIYEVGGKGIGRWAQEWNAAMRRAAAAKEPQERGRIIEEEKARNLGYKLYKALQTRGGWAQPPGYPVQLFGPWTRGEGPHKAISDRLLRMHRDHIHVAK
jgi:hypothetical protein